MTNKVGYSERTDVVIEPRLSLQWFLKMDEISKPALDNVMNDNVPFHPAKFKNSYRNWMENIRDWCISRQLWWGHRIPAWYYGDGEEEYVIARTAEKALEKAREKSGNSGLTASMSDRTRMCSTPGFRPGCGRLPFLIRSSSEKRRTKELEYYYPTQDLVTAPEIMFFWVARMIMAGYAFADEKPFSNVYYHGIVRDEKRRKMSKSLGNSPDPLELIKKYGADGTRVGMLFSAPAGNDLLFDEALCEQGRNFSNKIWNAFRFLTMNMEDGVELQSNHGD
jgi:valyl-tRNA synthetase